jgi:hypothetical protein
VIALLRRPEGATIDEVRAATGWQPHTVRGLFSLASSVVVEFRVVSARRAECPSTWSPARA